MPSTHHRFDSHLTSCLLLARVPTMSLSQVDAHRSTAVLTYLEMILESTVHIENTPL